MIAFDRAHDRYRNDPTYRALVSNLECMLLQLEISPSELREAAMYACYRTEMRSCRSMKITVSERERAELEAAARAMGLVLAKPDEIDPIRRPPR